MTPEIKHRIEQIRNGEVPEGYKRTRAGIMPCDWCTQKEYKAKDVFYSVSNKNHNGDYEVLSATQDRGVIPRSQVDIDIKYDDANIGGYKMVDKGDFVISLRSFQGGIEYSEYTGLVSPAYTVLKPRVSICDGYYKSYFKTNDFISRLNKGTYGIRDGKQVGFKDFGEMTIHFPPLPEQQRIAKILSAQDKVIECYEKKIEQLKQMKKYYLQNMFPKRGETVPKIRFKGFTDPWEQRKLGDVIEVSTRRNGNTYTKEDVLSVSDEYGCVNQIRFQGRSFAGEDISNYKIVDTGDIIYTRSPLQAKPYGIIKLVTAETGIVSPLYIVNKSIKGNDSEFIYRVFDSPHKTNYYLNPLVRKGAKNTMNISEDEWLSGEVIVSPNYEEQVTIGRFFRNLDTLITLHQRKLEEEKKKKKALQQLLLTGIVRTN